MKWSNNQVARYGVVVVWFLIVSVGLSGVVAPFVLPEQLYADMIRFFSDALYQQELNLATSPIANVSHRVFGLLFYVIGMAQFNRRLRVKHPALHRRCGRLYIALAAFVVVNAIMLAFRHAFAGQIEKIMTLMLSALFGGFTIIGLVKALRRDFAAHREYMMRGFATTLGIAVHRPFLGSSLFLFDLSEQALFVLSGFAAIGVCIIAAEIWIRLSRQVPYARIAG